VLKVCKFQFPPIHPPLGDFHRAAPSRGHDGHAKQVAGHREEMGGRLGGRGKRAQHKDEDDADGRLRGDCGRFEGERDEPHRREKKTLLWGDE
jgi:hypothetical protein